MHPLACPVVQRCATAGPLVVGVDEAGRGPVLGPMVYTALFTTDPAAVRALGVRDSKAMTSEARVELFRAIKRTPSVGYCTALITPDELNAQMCAPRKVSLNEVAYAHVAELLRHVAALTGQPIREVFADTVGPSAKYAAYIRAHVAGVGKVTVCPKADAKYPVVSAASIVAKVTRDVCVHRWLFAEDVPPAALGSGYPHGPPAATDAQTATRCSGCATSTTPSLASRGSSATAGRRPAASSPRTPSPSPSRTPPAATPRARAPSSLPAKASSPPRTGKSAFPPLFQLAASEHQRRSDFRMVRSVCSGRHPALCANCGKARPDEPRRANGERGVERGMH